MICPYAKPPVLQAIALLPVLTCISAKKHLRICFCRATEGSDWSGSSCTQRWCMRGSMTTMAAFRVPLSSGFLYLYTRPTCAQFKNLFSFLHIWIFLHCGFYKQRLFIKLIASVGTKSISIVYTKTGITKHHWQNLVLFLTAFDSVSFKFINNK